jgi:hypothetical protein
VRADGRTEARTPAPRPNRIWVPSAARDDRMAVTRTADAESRGLDAIERVHARASQGASQPGRRPR